MKNLSRKKELWLAGIFFTVLVFGVLLYTGTITSGWHLVDDQEYIDYILQMKVDGASYFECLKDTILKDLTWRFRPLYYILRVTFTVFFGTNLVAWSITKGIVTVIAFFFLYLCAREMKCSSFRAVLFSMVVMVGPQSVVWWKLGPQECTGMMLFSSAFYFLLKWMETRKQRYNCGALALLVMAGLYKESFLMMLPFAISYLFYIDIKREGFHFKTIWESFKKNVVMICTLVAFLIVALMVIFFYSGTDVGFYDSHMSPNAYKLLWINMLQNPLKWFVYAVIPLFFIMLTGIKKWPKLIWEFLLTMAVMIPQFILYLKLGFEERYIIPWVFGYAYFVVIALGNWEVMQGIRRTLYYCCIVGLLIMHFPIVISEGEYFTYRGHSVTEVFHTVLQESEPDSKILAAYSPYVESDLTLSFWMRLNGRDHVYAWDNDALTCTDIVGEGEGNMADVQDMDFILFYNPQDRHYCYEPDIDLTDYTKTEYGTLVICRKNNK